MSLWLAERTRAQAQTLKEDERRDKLLDEESQRLERLYRLVADYDREFSEMCQREPVKGEAHGLRKLLAKFDMITLLSSLYFACFLMDAKAAARAMGDFTKWLRTHDGLLPEFTGPEVTFNQYIDGVLEKNSALPDPRTKVEQSLLEFRLHMLEIARTYHSGKVYPERNAMGGKDV